MSSRIVLSAIAITLLGSVAVFAQGQPQGPQQPMSFFVSSRTGSGNLGGLEGADKICQDLAAAAGAGNRTWHAYLSTEQRGNAPRVDARSRIGTGPWYNAKGVVISLSVADLHGDQQRDRNAIQASKALDEHGNIVPGLFTDNPPGVRSQHDILTGSDSHGRAFTDGLDHTCNNWTSNSDENQAMIGHHDRAGDGSTSWNMSHMTRGCSAEALVSTGGAGRIYCFAIN